MYIRYTVVVYRWSMKKKSGTTTMFPRFIGSRHTGRRSSLRVEKVSS